MPLSSDYTNFIHNGFSDSRKITLTEFIAIKMIKLNSEKIVTNLFKKSNKFTLNFGHSHWCKLWYNINFFKFFKIRRQNYVVLFNSRWDEFYLKFLFSKIRIYNRYTKRGIKLKKTPYIRRFGKISQVNSSLHSF